MSSSAAHQMTLQIQVVWKYTCAAHAPKRCLSLTVQGNVTITSRVSCYCWSSALRCIATCPLQDRVQRRSAALSFQRLCIALSASLAERGDQRGVHDIGCYRHRVATCAMRYASATARPRVRQCGLASSWRARAHVRAVAGLSAVAV